MGPVSHNDQAVELGHESWVVLAPKILCASTLIGTGTGTPEMGGPLGNMPPPAPRHLTEAWGLPDVWQAAAFSSWAHVTPAPGPSPRMGEQTMSSWGLGPPSW